MTYHEPDIVEGKRAHLRVLKANGTWRDKWDVTTYQASCACGWRGAERTSSYDAEDDAAYHRIHESEEWSL